MLFSNIGIIDENFDFQPNRWVGVRDGRIDYLGTEAPQDADSYGEIYPGEGRLLMPAFYNAHAHAPMTLLRGYAENLPLQEWLNNMVWPFEAKMTPEDNYWATLLACAEMARYGCVSYSDMYYATPERVKATLEVGLKANLCEGLLAFEPKPFEEYPQCELIEKYVADHHGQAGDRIRMEYCIHAEYTSNPLTCKGVIEKAQAAGLGIHLHLSETESEVSDCRERHEGMSPVQYFDSLGAFNGPVTAAHCVWVDDADIKILADRGVYAVNNPASNMKLGSGFAPIPQMLEEGVNVCLGTDGMASNNNHDMFQDMYLMATIYKGQACDPAVVSPKEVLRAATRTGALCQGRKDCGLVKEGFRADLCVLDVTGPSWTPMTNPLVNIVFAGHGSDVVLTMADGQIAYRDGEYPGIDIEAVKAQVAERTQRIIAEVNEG